MGIGGVEMAIASVEVEVFDGLAEAFEVTVAYPA